MKSKYIKVQLCIATLSLLIFFCIESKIIGQEKLSNYDLIWMPEGFVPKEMNDSGQVVGTYNHDGRSEAARWTLINEKVTVLKESSDKNFKSTALGISENGIIFATKRKGIILKNFLWTEKMGIIEICAPKELKANIITAHDLNAKNQVIGYFSNENELRGFIWSPEMEMKDLGNLTETTRVGFNSVQPFSINVHGWISGHSMGRPFLLKRKGFLKELGSPDGFDAGFPFKITDSGKILINLLKANYHPNIKKPMRPMRLFQWTEDGGYKSLPPLEGYNLVTGLDLNEHDEIILSGYQSSSDKNFVHFLMQNNSLMKLPVPTGFDQAMYIDINNHGLLMGKAINWSGDKIKQPRGFILRPEK